MKKNEEEPEDNPIPMRMELRILSILTLLINFSTNTFEIHLST